MVEFKRSPQASQSYSKFMGKDYYILLENENDTYFWQKILKKVYPEKKFIFESVASSKFINRNDRGKESLKFFLKEYEENLHTSLKKGSVYIFWDADYDIFKRIEHPMIVDTYGYTIENTLFCPNRITKIILEEIPLHEEEHMNVKVEINNWYNEMVDELEEFMVLNLAAELNKKNVENIKIQEVMGRTSDKYLNSIKKLDLNEVRKKISELNINKKYIAEAKILIENSNFEKRFIISGHFWEALILNKCKEIIIHYKKKLKRENDKCRIDTHNLLRRSNEKCSSSCIDRSGCKDYNYTINKIKSKIK